MNSTNLTLCVIPSDTEMKNIVGYVPALHGKVLSSLAEIKVNKTNNGYGILYHSNDIKNMDIDILGNNIIKLFMDNIPNTNINFQLLYLFEVVDNDDNPYNGSDISVINSLLKMEQKFCKFNGDGNIPFTYFRSEIMNHIINSIIDDYRNMEDEDDDCDDVTGLSQYFKSFGISPIEDDYDDDDDEDSLDFLDSHLRGTSKSNSKHKRHKSYPESKIFRDAKNPKRAYHRHGVIICTDKEAKRRDKKILKEFLEEFFPGDSEWKKDFRREVLKRWMKMYCVTKKDLKAFEKTHRKAVNAKRNNARTEKTLEYARRVFNVPIDRWNDPNR